MDSTSEINTENKQTHSAESRRVPQQAGAGRERKAAVEMAATHSNQARTVQAKPVRMDKAANQSIPQNDAAENGNKDGKPTPVQPKPDQATLEAKEPLEAKPKIAAIAAERTLADEPTKEMVEPIPSSPKLAAKTPVATDRPFKNQQHPKAINNGRTSNPNKNQQTANANSTAKAQPNKGPVRGGQGAAGMTHAKATQANRKIPRPEAWEDDISRNALDDSPFTSLASPASRDVMKFREAARFQTMKPLLEGVPIGKFLQKDSWPIPTPEDREGYSAGYDENYWICGLEDYLKIMQVAKNLGVVANSVLDFGCATGRVVRHFAAQSDAKEVWATDINHRHVRWLYEFMPNKVKPVFNHCIPTLPIPDKSVDIITAFSVFTHIDTFETHWLAELSRIMSDDGMCYLTVHNEDTWEKLEQEKDNEKNRLIQSIVKIDPNFKQTLTEPMPDKRTIYRFTQSGPYRAQVFHSNNYLHKVWGRFFDIEAIMPCHHVRQTVVVLRKKSS